MHPAAELQVELTLTLTLATLRRRRVSAGEAAEQKVLTRVIARLGKAVAALDAAAVSRQCGAVPMLKAVLG